MIFILAASEVSNILEERIMGTSTKIDIQETARRLRKKRPRERQSRDPSPELHAEISETSRTTKTRRQRRVRESPAKQSQPRIRKGQHEMSGRRQSDGDHISITVHRYTGKQRYNDDDSDSDGPPEYYTGGEKRQFSLFLFRFRSYLCGCWLWYSLDFG